MPVALFFAMGWRGHLSPCQVPLMGIGGKSFFGINAHQNEIFSICSQVFTEELIADDLLNAVKILNLIESEKRKVQAAIKKQENFDRRFIFLIDGAYHALFAVGQLCDARGVDRLDFENAKKLVPNAMEYIAQLVASAQESDESFSFNRYFKDAKTKTRVASCIQAEKSKNL
ncbi:hypothetical protein [Halovibrio sp. HP20-50]|uniref:hypothetical protein n=1 Tax=Halovibrio sp. HP20-59 TaxID=3080275 RepID=UPI00294B8E06|nr:hypothetical protein [Halovibrio sp. HP20-59]MEA2116991.1 hypothetical protein [Halovibrio sp. HP20-59]